MCHVRPERARSGCLSTCHLCVISLCLECNSGGSRLSAGFSRAFPSIGSCSHCVADALHLTKYIWAGSACVYLLDPIAPLFTGDRSDPPVAVSDARAPIILKFQKAIAGRAAIIWRSIFIRIGTYNSNNLDGGNAQFSS